MARDIVFCGVSISEMTPAQLMDAAGQVVLAWALSERAVAQIPDGPWVEDLRAIKDQLVERPLTTE